MARITSVRNFSPVFLSFFPDTKQPNNHTEGYRSGHNEAVLNTVCLHGRVGSNPTPSAASRCAKANNDGALSHLLFSLGFFSFSRFFAQKRLKMTYFSENGRNLRPAIPFPIRVYRTYPSEKREKSVVISRFPPVFVASFGYFKGSVHEICRRNF